MMKFVSQVTSGLYDIYGGRVEVLTTFTHSLHDFKLTAKKDGEIVEELELEDGSTLFDNKLQEKLERTIEELYFKHLIS